MSLGAQVGLGQVTLCSLGHRDHMKRDTAPNFRPMSVLAKLGLGPDDIVLDGDPAPRKKWHSTHFSAHIYCGQTAGWSKMPLGTKVGLGAGHIVLDGDPAPFLPKRGTHTHFRPVSIVDKRSPISATAEHFLFLLLHYFMAALRSRCGHYVFALWLVSSSSFFFFFSFLA